MFAEDEWWPEVFAFDETYNADSYNIKTRFPGLVVWDWKKNGTENRDKCITVFSTRWTVPPEPTKKSKQFIALFNGMKPYDIIKEEGLILKQILQPVLRWGGDNSGQSWSVSSYFVKIEIDTRKNPKKPETKVIIASSTKPIQVSPGLDIVGRITQRKAANDDESAGYICTCEFDGLIGTGLTVDIPDELVWTSIVLEVKRIQTCDQLPATELTSYQEIIIESGGNRLNPEWNILNNNPGCNVSADVVSHDGIQDQVNIKYK